MLSYSLGVTDYVTFIAMTRVHFVVLLKSNIDLQQTCLRGWLIVQQVLLSYSLVLTNYVLFITMTLVHFVVILKSDLDGQQTCLRGQFVEQKVKKVMLWYSFRCDRISSIHFMNLVTLCCAA
jgi:hypothetical protein